MSSSAFCFTRSAFAITTLAGAVSLSCASHAASMPPPATASRAQVPTDDEEASGLLEHHRYHHHGGVTLFIAMSIDTLGLPPAERAAAEKIRLDLHAQMQPALAADQALASTLADGLDAATFDRAKVDLAVSQVATTAAAVHEASAKALNELHAALTPPERAALVDKVESHWAVWQRANAEQTAEQGAESGHLAMLSADLGLSKEQIDRIRTSMSVGLKGVPRLDPKAVDLQLKAFGEEFRSDKFDAQSLAGKGDANAQLASWGAAHLAHFIEAASPELSVEQRAKLAKRLREHAAHDPSAQAQVAQ